MKFLFVFSAVLALEAALGVEVPARPVTVIDEHEHGLLSHGYDVDKTTRRIVRVGGGENLHALPSADNGGSKLKPNAVVDGNVAVKENSDGSAFLFNIDTKDIVGFLSPGSDTANLVGSTVGVEKDDGSLLLVDPETNNPIGVVGNPVKAIGPKGAVLVDRPTKTKAGTNLPFDPKDITKGAKNKHQPTGNVVLLLKPRGDGVLVNKRNALLVGRVPLDGSAVLEDNIIPVDIDEDNTLLVDNTNGNVVGTVSRYVEVVDQDTNVLFVDKYTKEVKCNSEDLNGNGGADDLIERPVENSSKSKVPATKRELSEDEENLLTTRDLINQNLQEQLNDDKINLGTVVALEQPDKNIVFVNTENGRIVAVKNKDNAVDYVGEISALKSQDGLGLLNDADSDNVQGVIGNVVQLLRPDGTSLLINRSYDNLVGVASKNGKVFLVGDYEKKAVKNARSKSAHARSARARNSRARNSRARNARARNARTRNARARKANANTVIPELLG